MPDNSGDWSDESDHWDILRALIVSVETEESNVLCHLLFQAELIKIVGLWKRRALYHKREAVFSFFLRTRKKELGYTGTILICMSARSSKKARDSVRLRQLLFDPEEDEASAIERVLDLNTAVQTPAALVLQCLLLVYQDRTASHEGDLVEDFKLLAQRAKSDSSRTDKTFVEAVGDFDQSLNGLHDTLVLHEFAVTEEMIMVAAETVGVNQVRTLMEFANFNIHITQDLSDATEKNTRHGSYVREYLLRCVRRKSREPHKDVGEDSPDSREIVTSGRGNLQAMIACKLSCSHGTNPSGQHLEHPH